MIRMANRVARCGAFPDAACSSMQRVALCREGRASVELGREAGAWEREEEGGWLLPAGEEWLDAPEQPHA